jgi:hypothetical protein
VKERVEEKKKKRKERDEEMVIGALLSQPAALEGS